MSDNMCLILFVFVVHTCIIANMDIRKIHKKMDEGNSGEYLRGFGWICGLARDRKR